MKRLLYVYLILAVLTIFVGLLTGCTGPRGESGSQATIVQLCAGTPVFNQVSPPVAICVDNQLYTTYGSNGGYMAMLPTGRYQISYQGGTCTFNVTPNCQVSN